MIKSMVVLGRGRSKHISPGHTQICQVNFLFQYLDADSCFRQGKKLEALEKAQVNDPINFANE